MSIYPMQNYVFMYLPDQHTPWEMSSTQLVTANHATLFKKYKTSIEL